MSYAIKQNISQRSSAELKIRRTAANGLFSTVATVPITPRSVRRFMLMQEDYIQLEFSLAEAVNFAIGDYVLEDMFGTFYITQEQMPKFNPRTTGYDYSLRLDADYMLWRNWILCLMAGGERMESRWNLTDKLAVHAQQIADNVNDILNPSETNSYNTQTGEYTYHSDGYGIVVTADNAAEVKHLSYDGVSIIDAMNMIAAAWGCEWWVVNESVTVGNRVYAHAIHFGKCESGDPYVMSLGTNLESMDVTRDQQTYANRIYAYGGTQNVPESYDRKMVLTATMATTAGTNSRTFTDAARPLTSEMIKGTTTYGTWSFPDVSGTVISQTNKEQSTSISLDEDNYLVTGRFTATLRCSSGVSTYKPAVGFQVWFNGIKVAEGSNLAQASDLDGGYSWLATSIASNWVINPEPLEPRNMLKLSSAAVVELKVVWLIYSFPTTGTLTSEITVPDLVLTGGEKTASRAIQVIINNTTYGAVFNPSNSYGDSDASKITVNGISRAGLIVGTKVTIPEEYLNVLNVPYSFYSLDYSLGTLGLLGERRLHLPLEAVDDKPAYPNRYAELTVRTAVEQVVEQVVIFEGIFPKMSLVVSEVSTETRTDEIVHDDGSVERQNWVQYKFKVTDENGGPFTFDTRYILDGNRLAAAFTASVQASTGGFMLGGMTFEVGFDNSTQTFTVIRNEDYGAKLPNGWLYPQAGDTLFLTGWNPKALESMNLVSDAEQELAEHTRQYLAALKEGQFTFNCRMMSMTLMAYPFCTGTGYDSDNKRMFGLLQAGARVTIDHAALPGGSKTSRVIGYEYKLDIPYDTPTYIIGETEAYSRLKQIEKELTKLT